MPFKKIAKQIGWALMIVAIATVIDYVLHATSERFSVPAEYFRNKVIFATIWGLVGLWLMRHWVKNPTKLAVAMSAIIAVVLQTKYFLQGYDLFFVFLFMFLHFIMFLIPAVLIFRKHPHLFVK